MVWVEATKRSQDLSVAALRSLGRRASRRMTVPVGVNVRALSSAYHRHREQDRFMRVPDLAGVASGRLAEEQISGYLAVAAAGGDGHCNLKFLRGE
jgi:hypothetical protein